MTKRKHRFVRVLLGGLPLLLLVCLGWAQIRKHMMPPPPPATAAMRAQAKQVKIVRDRWGVPHIFGQTDADAAFGLAYAHAEDDFRTIQLVIAAVKGKLSLLLLSKQAIGNDFYVALVRVREQVAQHYKKLSPETRAVLEGYARGISYYAALHPKEADGRIFPVTGRDVAAGFVHKIPLMFNMPRVLGALNKARNKQVGDPVFGPPKTKKKRVAQAHTARTTLASRLLRFGAPHGSKRFATTAFHMPGSNTHAVHKSRFVDGITRLNVNSHQPWEGPVAWYEAHISSKQGWNMLGGTFPGAPVILHGHNDHLGWAHTVNFPDLVDVYKLKTFGTQTIYYLLDGKRKRLESKTAKIQIDTGLFTFTLRMKAYWSDHGPVFKTRHGYYAIRYAGIGRAIFATEQWYKMNKARSFKEWKQAMRMNAMPMFNTGYADRNNVFYVYNALLPMRKPGFDYKTILPGDRSDLIWTKYLPWDKLPHVHNPPSGFIQNCNSTPFHTTRGKGNPNPKDFDKHFGIETNVNNRAHRSLALLAPSRKQKLTRKDFLTMKFDRTYHKDAAIMKDVIRPLLSSYKARTITEKKGLALLKQWNRQAHMNNRQAALALLTWHPLGSFTRRGKPGTPHTPALAFQEALSFLMTNHGRLDVPLSTVQRVRRGKLNIGVDGGPDLLRAVHAKRTNKGQLVGIQGDSYILIAEFTDKGVRSSSRHQYGNANRPNSPHYADQAPHFSKRTFKTVTRSYKTLQSQNARTYHPGQP